MAWLNVWVFVLVGLCSSATIDGSEPVTATVDRPVTGAQDSAGKKVQTEAGTKEGTVAGEEAGEGHEHHANHEPLGKLVPAIAVIPFALILLGIACFPLVSPHWWEDNRNKAIVVSLIAVPTAIYLSMVGQEGQGVHALGHAATEYISFVALLASLFVISGGIYIRGTFVGTPMINTCFLTLGALIASFVGTTGASMLLIRPLLRANESRLRVTHTIVFFIFIVSNCGGLLTPLGDPPLFLGFLKGVPFLWTLRLFPQWLMVNGLLLVVYFVLDSFLTGNVPVDSEAAPVDDQRAVSFGIEGLHNAIFLAAIVAIIYCSGQGYGNNGQTWPWGIQEGMMLLTMIGSYFLTSGEVREKNRFSFGPILEVAVLFIGIFVTMQPAMALLNVNGKTLGIAETWQFFWVSGILSSLLDNAPTYLTFAAVACGLDNISTAEGPYLREYLALGAKQAGILAAIACGAVFMGANTYIGNGPNFMVKAIAEENNVRMPSFFGYMAWSLGVLVPIFVILTFVFFR